jgi:hypothetical protein
MDIIHCPVLYLKKDVSETAFDLLGPKYRTNLSPESVAELIYLQTIQFPKRRVLNKRTMDVEFEVFTAATMMNSVSWDVTPCGPCKN